MLQIKNTLGGGGAKVTIDGVKVKGELNLVSEVLNPKKSVSTLPYAFYDSSAVVLNGEIHIFSTYFNSFAYGLKHYKWDGSSWTSVSTLPYNAYGCSAVIYNGEIHILGSYGSKTNHYKWDGTS